MPLLPIGALIISTGITAAAATDPTGVPSYGYGAVGALAVALLGFALRAYVRETKRADAAEAREQAANAYIREQVTPTLLSAMDVLRRNAEHLDRQQIIAELDARRKP